MHLKRLILALGLALAASAARADGVAPMAPAMDGLTLKSCSGYAYGNGTSPVTCANTIPLSAVTGAAPLASPTFTGTPAAPTPTGSDNSTRLATTAYVVNALSPYATTSAVNSAIGSAVAPLATSSALASAVAPLATNSALTSGLATKQATLGFAPLNPASNLSDVASAATARANLGAAPLASPAFTGAPTAPTATAGDSTMAVATTAFVANAVSPLVTNSSLASQLAAYATTSALTSGLATKQATLGFSPLNPTNNLSDVASAATARANLGAAASGANADIASLKGASILFYGPDGTPQFASGYTGSAAEYMQALGGITGAGASMYCTNGTGSGSVSCNITAQGAGSVNYGNNGHGVLVRALDPGAAVVAPVKMTPASGSAAGDIDCGSNGPCTINGVAISAYGGGQMGSLNVNGDFLFDQVYGGGSSVVTSALVADGWHAIATSSRLQWQRIGTNGPPGYTFNEQINLYQLGGYTPASGDIFGLQTYITGDDADGLQWGTANGKPANLTLCLKGGTGITYPLSIPVAIDNNFVGSSYESYVVAVTIATSGNWYCPTFSIPAPPTVVGQWGKSANGQTSVAISVRVCFGAGSTHQASSLNTWANGANGVCGTSTTSNFVSQPTSSQIFLGAVHFRPGVVATPYTPLPYAMEKSRVQSRFFSTFTVGVPPAQAVGVNTGEAQFAAGVAGAGTERLGFRFPVPMVKAPTTVTLYSPTSANATCRDETASADGGAAASANATPNALTITCAGAAGTSVGNLMGVHFTADSGL